MSSGAAHAQAGAVLAVLGTGAALVAYGSGYLPAPILGWAVAGWWLGVIITPDLDLAGRTHEEARMARVPVIGWLWRIAWAPYAIIMPHRSVWSHGLLIGTAGRAAYVVAILLGACWLAGRTLALDWWAAVWCLPGWACQDALHLLMDGVSSA